MSCEQAGRNGARFDSLNSENSRNYREPVLRREERILKKTKMIISRPMKQFILMDDRHLMRLK